jgi:signal transduction histidine kinase
VVISAVPAGDAVEIAVADRGPGVAPQDRERALQRFVRLEKSRSKPGSGLGLSLVAAVARLHGGSIRLEDNAPGLRVVLRLPAGGPHAQASATPA